MTQHYYEACPLLIDRQGRIEEVPRKERRLCPYCKNQNTLKMANKAYRGWINFKPYAMAAYMNSYLEGLKTEKQLQEDAENF